MSAQMQTDFDVVPDVTELSPSFPFSVWDEDKASPLPDGMHQYHCLSIHFVKEGSGELFINDDIYQLEKGDIVLTGPNDLYGFLVSTELIIQTTTFDPHLLVADRQQDPEILCPFMELGGRFDNLLDRTNPMMRELRSILMTVQLEYESQATSYMVVIRAELLRSLAYVTRYFAKDINWLLPGCAKDAIQTVVTIMEAQFTKPWSLCSLAKLAHLSPSRFSALFRQTVGMAPFEYLIQLRLAHALELLKKGDMKIIDISLECGFTSLSNFHRLFRKHLGKSPTQMRPSAQARTYQVVMAHSFRK